MSVLSIRELTLSFRLWSGPVEVLHGISLDIEAGERVALVGESGSGKSVTARIVLGLLQDHPGVRIGGRVDFQGRALATLTARERRDLRGRDISMIFQDPTSSLNPVFRIGGQFQEVLARRAPRIGAATARARAIALLEEVAIAEPDRVLDSYPFQLSGGMNQRVMIAMALANRPALLLADEPGTALDVTVQAQTLALMRRLVADHGTAVLFISHNLGVVREFADRLYVIRRGIIVEAGPTAAVFARPGHPYTRALLAAQPRLTGGGLPAIAEGEQGYLAPPVIHGGRP
jgi:ABC-type dipeptide/oligopeptide/nickel transport system ATPase component